VLSYKASMPNVYLDQNALIYAGKKGQKDAAFGTKLLDAITATGSK